MDQIGAIYRKRSELLGNFKIAFLPFCDRRSTRFTVDHIVIVHYDLWGLWGTL